MRKPPRLSVPIFQKAGKLAGELPCKFCFCRYNSAAVVKPVVRAGYCTEPEKFESGNCTRGFDKSPSKRLDLDYVY